MIRGLKPFVLGCVVALAACDDPPVERDIVRPVFTTTVGDISAIIETEFPGRARAESEVNRSFRVSGPLIERPVDIGDSVEQGQLLARIDPQDFEVLLANVENQLERARAELAAMRVARPEDIRSTRAALEQARAGATRANQDLDRLNNIREEDPGAVAQVMIDRAVEAKRQADAGVRRATEDLRIAERGARAEDIAAKEAQIGSLEATVQTARDNLSYTNLTAPFDGVVVATFVENFEFVHAQQPIIRLLDPRSIEFTIFVPENLIGYAPFVTGSTVVFDTMPETPISASIKEIALEASQATRTYPVTLLLDVPEGVQVLPGMAGTATVAAELPAESQRVGAEVPATAVFTSGDAGQSFVWVVDQSDMLQQRAVATGPLTEFGILITDGLSAGDVIVTKGVNSLSQGQQVRRLDSSTEDRS